MAATPQSRAKAMDELVFYYNAKKGKFGGVMVQLAAYTSSPGM